uniref:Uncharacterized protein n=1 Tax=Anguilla anguilla TaxID=7936 RepID=A0A0E9R3J4_ANGAN
MQYCITLCDLLYWCRMNCYMLL